MSLLCTLIYKIIELAFTPVCKGTHSVEQMISVTSAVCTDHIVQSR